MWHPQQSYFSEVSLSFILLFFGEMSRAETISLSFTIA